MLIRAWQVIFWLGALFAAGPIAAMCATPPDRSDLRAELFAELEAATNEGDGRAAANEIWRFWSEAPDDVSQDLLDEGITAIRYADYAKAETGLRDLTEYCPAYAEGWNQYAFALFLQGKYDPSRAALEKTLRLEPDHFGALAGIGLTYLRQDKPALAQIWLRRAVTVNPWINERTLLQNLSKDGSDL